MLTATVSFSISESLIESVYLLEILEELELNELALGELEMLLKANFGFESDKVVLINSKDEKAKSALVQVIGKIANAVGVYDSTDGKYIIVGSVHPVHRIGDRL